MRKLVQSNGFKKQLKLAKKRGKDLEKLIAIIELLQQDTPLPKKNKDHSLVGDFVGFKECHIEPDWLLVYKKECVQDELGYETLVLKLEATGTHSDLFG